MEDDESNLLINKEEKDKSNNEANDIDSPLLSNCIAVQNKKTENINSIPINSDSSSTKNILNLLDDNKSQVLKFLISYLLSQPLFHFFIKDKKVINKIKKKTKPQRILVNRLLITFILLKISIIIILYILYD